MLLATLAAPNRGQGDGIAVGKPKIFDNRALTLMLEQLNQQLAQVQVVDQKSLAASLGVFQGSQTQEVSRSLSVSTLPLPEIKTTEQANSSGQLMPSQQTTDRAAVNPSAPALPEALAAPNFQPKYGPSANDLLSDQVNLTYQIFNFRMLLERSLSDRLWQDPAKPERIGQRLQAVIGFDVTIDPPRNAKDCAAVVQITIAPSDAGNQPISLVAMMPQEKTYNSAALNTHSTAFGGSAVAKIITIGYSERHRGQIFYLFRDTDTISVEGVSNPAGVPSNAVTFGWQFRPVLGRRSVSPGARQVFAVIALPDSDKYLKTSSDLSAPSVPSPDDQANASVSEQTYREKMTPPFKILVWRRVYWRKYDSKTLTTETKKEAKLGAPADLCGSSNPCLVPYTATIQGSLQPRIRDVKWRATDDKNAVVTVSGDNFFAGTSVYLGNATLDSEKNGLLIKSDQDLTLRTTLSAIASGDAILNGRYGASIPIVASVPGAAQGGVEIGTIQVETHPTRTTADLFLYLWARGVKDLTLPEFARACRPIVVVQGTVVPPPYSERDAPYKEPSGNYGNCEIVAHCVELRTQVAAELITKDMQVTIKCPFRSSLFGDSKVTYNPAIVKVALLGDDSKTKTGTLAIAGDFFDKGWAIELDKHYAVMDGDLGPGKLVLRGRNLLLLQVGADVLKGYKNLVLLPSNGQPIVVAIPEASAAPATPQPKLTCAQPITVEQNSSHSVACSGEGLSSITSATFEGLSLTFKLVSEKEACAAPSSGTAEKTECLRVFLTRQVTRKAGPVEVILHTKDDKSVIPLKIMVQPGPIKPTSSR